MTSGGETNRYGWSMVCQSIFFPCSKVY